MKNFRSNSKRKSTRVREIAPFFFFEEGGKIMIVAKECCIRGEILLDGAYSTGRGIASSYLLRFSPLEGEYLLYETGRVIWLINRRFENSKLEYSRKELPHRVCASYRKDIKHSLSKLVDNGENLEPFAVLFDEDLNEMSKLPISVSDDLGLKVEVARHHGRIVAVRITKSATTTPKATSRGYDDKSLAKTGVEALRPISSNVKRYWYDERKRLSLHSVFVDLLFDVKDEGEDAKAFVQENESEILALAKEAVRGQGYPDVNVDELIATRLFAWPGGSAAVNFVRRE